DELTEEDYDILRPFALKVNMHMPGSTFAQLPYAFPKSNISSWKAIQSRVAQMSGFKPEVYHCCVESCCCFTGPLSDKTVCPYCNEPRYDSRGRPRKVFVYLPVVPRLKALAMNKSSAQQMRYRAQEHEHQPGVIKDIMDSTAYLALKERHVVVDGKELPHKFFEDARDVALGLSTDGFAPFKWRTKT
ncbi:hypothetical protein BV20DRAFT_927515, partial [Pilatotrama ljubarskyi]